ncbi:MAG: hypothetical protein ACTSPD_10315 [Promethearchaeota archaeon]
MKEKIAILYTTFLRDELMYQTINSIINNWQDNWILLIGDQGIKENENIQKKMNKINAITKGKMQVYYYKLAFDCGLSLARNYLVKKAYDMGIPYCLLTADSIKFTKSIQKIHNLTYLLSQSKYASIIGLGLQSRVSWEYRMQLEKGKHFVLIATDDYIEYPIPEVTYELKNNRIVVIYQKVTFKKIDICKNFFLAKTRVLYENPWDITLKLCEHEDFFWRLKQKGGGLVYWTNYCEGEYISYKPAKYNTYRRRMYEEYRRLLQKKYNITGWIKAIQ